MTQPLHIELEALRGQLETTRLSMDKLDAIKYLPENLDLYSLFSRTMLETIHTSVDVEFDDNGGNFKVVRFDGFEYAFSKSDLSTQKKEAKTLAIELHLHALDSVLKEIDECDNFTDLDLIVDGALADDYHDFLSNIVMPSVVEDDDSPITQDTVLMDINTAMSLVGDTDSVITTIRQSDAYNTLKKAVA